MVSLNAATSISIDSEVMRRAKEAAERQHVNFSQYLEWVLKKELSDYAILTEDELKKKLDHLWNESVVLKHELQARQEATEAHAKAQAEAETLLKATAEKEVERAKRQAEVMDKFMEWWVALPVEEKDAVNTEVLNVASTESAFVKAQVRRNIWRRKTGQVEEPVEAQEPVEKEPELEVVVTQ